MKKLLLLSLVISSILIGLYFWHKTSNADNLSHSLRDAAKNNDIEMAGKLINQGADPNKKFEGGSALKVAIQKGNVAMVKFLIDHGAHVFGPETNRFLAWSLLDDAIEYASGMVVEYEEEETIAPEKIKNQKEIVSILANTNAPTRYPKIFIAILEDDLELVKELAKKGDLKNLSPEELDQLSRIVKRSNNKEIVRYLKREIPNL